MESEKILCRPPCHFNGDLKTASLADSKWEVLLESFQWEFGAATPIETPAGLISDGGPSVPPERTFAAGGGLFGLFFALGFWAFFYPWLKLLWAINLPFLFCVLFFMPFWAFVGIYLRYRIRPEKFKIVGYLHDWLRNYLTTGNATTDAMLRDAAYWNRPDKISPFDAWLIYLGVRIGTHIGFKSEPPPEVITDGIKVYARHLGIYESQLEYVPELSIIKPKDKS